MPRTAPPFFPGTAATRLALAAVLAFGGLVASRFTVADVRRPFPWTVVSARTR